MCGRAESISNGRKEMVERNGASLFAYCDGSGARWSVSWRSGAWRRNLARMTDVGDSRKRKVDVWLADPEWALDGEFEATCLGILDAGERVRENRFIAQGARREFLVGRLIVRRTLSRLGAVAPEDWRFQENEHGRPSVLSPELEADWRFNLSHTRGLVAVATIEGLEIGLDVEAIDRSFDFLPIARRKFSVVEADRVVAAAPVERRELFFRYWTLKEAFIKAKGIGLSLPLDKFSFDFLGDRELEAEFRDPLVEDPRSWRFAIFSVGTRHRLALAIEAPPEVELELSFHWLEGPSGSPSRILPIEPIGRSANWPTRGLPGSWS